MLDVKEEFIIWMRVKRQECYDSLQDVIGTAGMERLAACDDKSAFHEWRTAYLDRKLAIAIAAHEGLSPQDCRLLVTMRDGWNAAIKKACSVLKDETMVSVLNIEKVRTLQETNKV